MRFKFSIFFLAIVIITTSVVGYWYYQERIFSKEVLRLEILGPESIQTGEDFEYTLRYKNNGNFTLEEPKLIFEYPKYSLVEEGKTRISKDLQDIYPGEETTLKFKNRLLGKEGELKEVKAWLSYRPKNLKARYEAETTFTTKIELVPITLEFDLPSKSESGREIQFSLNYFFNVDYSLSDARIIVEYPEDFEFLESIPRALGKTDWEIPLLKKADGGRIKIKGKLNAKIGEYLNFGAKLGVWKEGEFVLLKETKKEIVIIEPLLYISQQINGVSDYIASPGETLHYEIFFRNIGASPFENLFLLTRLEGLAFDLSTLKADSGEIKPDDNLIIWDWKQIPELRFLDIQTEGRVKFEVKLKEFWFLEEDKLNQTVIKNKVNISQISQEFQTKVNSKLEISQKGYFQDEVFGNSGHIPPIVGEKTTYTIIWQAKNYYNDVKNVKVKATLPSWVELTGRIFPQEKSTRFSFDSQSREIVWAPAEGLMTAGTGVLNQASSIAFQIALIPKTEQKGKTLQIIGKTKIVGEDQWTEKTIEDTAEAIDTALPDDQTVNEEQGIIR